MIDKEIWNIGTDRDKTEKIIKYNMPAQCHKKRFFFNKKTFLK